jgi:D-serine deaminase-like pyridoxal phosphate-dependent protein
MSNPTYQYYNQLFKQLQLPLAYCDINLLEKNCQDIALRAEGNKTIS